MRKPAFTAQFSKPEQCLHTHHVKQRDSVRSQFWWRRLVHQSKTAQVLSCWANRWVTATPEAGQSRQRALSTLTDTGCRHTVKICNRTQLCAITCHNNIYDNPDEICLWHKTRMKLIAFLESMSPLCPWAPVHSRYLMSIWGENRINEHPRDHCILQPTPE